MNWFQRLVSLPLKTMVLFMPHMDSSFIVNVGLLPFFHFEMPSLAFTNDGFDWLCLECWLVFGSIHGVVFFLHFYYLPMRFCCSMHCFLRTWFCFPVCFLFSIHVNIHFFKNILLKMKINCIFIFSLFHESPSRI